MKTSVLEDIGVYIDSYEYVDGFGRCIQMITPSANNKKTVINKVYDSMGRNYLTEGPYFHPYNSFQYTDVLPPSGTYPYVHTAYDYHGRPVTVTTPAGSAGYSYNGFITTITDPDNRVRTVTTDYLGRTIQVTDGSGGSPALYTYNAAGDLTSVTDANGEVTSINYYMTGLKKNMTDPVMGFWEYEYDLNGNLIKQTDAKHDITEFEYDALNRVKLKTYTIYDDEETQYTHDVFYAYDMGINGKGLLSSVDNIDVHTSYDTYDGMGRVVKVIKNIAGSGSKETLYEYDKSGKTKKITYPGGYIVTNSYYPRTDLLYTVAGDSVVYATLSNYDPSGKIGKIEYGNGVVTDYTYDSGTTRLGSIQTKRGSTYYQNRTYGYTNAGNISSIYDGVNYKTYTYGYDGAGRLDWEESGGNYVDLVYDEAGNITSHTIDMYNDIDISYDTNRKNVINYATVNSQNYYFSHDPNGNMTLGYDFTIPSQVGQRNISYNANNMPAKIIYSRSGAPDVTTYFMYDGNGARVRKTCGSDIYFYFGDHYETKNGTPIIYIFAGNMRIAKRENGNVTYFHKDHLGSSTVMTDANGNKIGSNIEYYPFGGQRNPGDTIPTHYRFTDQEFDAESGAESGLYNYDARLYDPIIGRFISPDTIIPQPYNPQSLNRYSYCLNNPLIYVDPSGHQETGYDINKLYAEMTPGDWDAYWNLLEFFKMVELYAPDPSLYLSGFEVRPTDPEAMILAYVLGEVRASKASEISKEEFQKQYGEILRKGGISIEDNIIEAKRMNSKQFINAVKDEGDWDYKNKRALLDSGISVDLLNKFGNVHFGIVAAARGMQLAETLVGGGAYEMLYQERGGTWRELALGALTLFSPKSNYIAKTLVSGGFNYGDTPGAALCVTQGWNYYHEYYK